MLPRIIIPRFSPIRDGWRSSRFVGAPGSLLESTGKIFGFPERLNTIARRIGGVKPSGGGTQLRETENAFTLVRNGPEELHLLHGEYGPSIDEEEKGQYLRNLWLLSLKASELPQNIDYTQTAKSITESPHLGSSRLIEPSPEDYFWPLSLEGIGDVDKGDGLLSFLYGHPQFGGLAGGKFEATFSRIIIGANDSGDKGVVNLRGQTIINADGELKQDQHLIVGQQAPGNTSELFAAALTNFKWSQQGGFAHFEGSSSRAITAVNATPGAGQKKFKIQNALETDSALREELVDDGFSYEEHGQGDFLKRTYQFFVSHLEQASEAFTNGLPPGRTLKEIVQDPNASLIERSPEFESFVDPLERQLTDRDEQTKKDLFFRLFWLDVGDDRKAAISKLIQNLDLSKVVNKGSLKPVLRKMIMLDETTGIRSLNPDFVIPPDTFENVQQKILLIHYLRHQLPPDFVTETLGKVELPEKEIGKTAQLSTNEVFQLLQMALEGTSYVEFTERQLHKNALDKAEQSEPLIDAAKHKKNNLSPAKVNLYRNQLKVIASSHAPDAVAARLEVFEKAFPESEFPQFARLFRSVIVSSICLDANGKVTGFKAPDSVTDLKDIEQIKMMQALWERHSPQLSFNKEIDLENNVKTTRAIKTQIDELKSIEDDTVVATLNEALPMLLNDLFLISRRYEIPFNELALGLTDGPEKTLISNFVSARNFDLGSFIDRIQATDNCRSMINTFAVLFRNLSHEVAIKLFEKRVEDIPPQLLRKWLEAELMQGRQIFSTLPLAEIQTKLRNSPTNSDLIFEESDNMLVHQLFSNPKLLRDVDTMNAGDLAQWILPQSLHGVPSYTEISSASMQLNENDELIGFHNRGNLSPAGQQKLRLYKIALERVLQDGKQAALIYSPENDAKQTLKAIQYLKQNAKDNILWCASPENERRRKNLLHIADEYFMGAFCTLKRFDIPVEAWSKNLDKSEMGRLIIALMEDKLDFEPEFNKIESKGKEQLEPFLDAYNIFLTNIEAHLEKRLKDLQPNAS